MRVAIDASFLELPPSGTGTYVRALCDALSDIDGDLDLRLLEPAWDSDPSFDGPLRRLANDRRVRRVRWETVGVARAARRERADLLHIPHFSAPIWSGIPTVVTVHDVIPFVLPSYRSSAAMRWHLRLMRGSVRRARRILTPSQAAAADIERVLKVPGERIRVTPEAVDAAFRPGNDQGEVAALRRRLGIASRYVFNIGSLDVRKNLPVLIEAFDRVAAAAPRRLDLVIAGAPHSDNPTVFPPLEPVIERFGLGGRVHLTGRVSEAEKLTLMQGAALYVTPSLYEGFGLTALEAMACGVPTIAANRTSLPEVVGDGGLLVEPDVESLAAAMASVLDDPALAADLARRGIARAAEFSWRRTAELTLAAYREAVTQPA